jgi:hypothetical protein
VRGRDLENEKVRTDLEREKVIGMEAESENERRRGLENMTVKGKETEIEKIRGRELKSENVRRKE